MGPSVFLLNIFNIFYIISTTYIKVPHIHSSQHFLLNGTHFSAWTPKPVPLPIFFLPNILHDILCYHSIILISGRIDYYLFRELMIHHSKLICNQITHSFFPSDLRYNHWDKNRHLFYVLLSIFYYLYFLKFPSLNNWTIVFVFPRLHYFT